MAFLLSLWNLLSSLSKNAGLDEVGHNIIPNWIPLEELYAYLIGPAQSNLKLGLRRSDLLALTREG